MSISVKQSSDPAADGRSDDRSLGELVGTATRELSTLVRKEVELAKLELKGQVATAGKGAGMLGGAGLLGFFALLFLSAALALGLWDLGLEGWAAALVVGALYAVGAAVLGLLGKRRMARVRPPERTIETLKEDVEWVRNRRS